MTLYFRRLTGALMLDAGAFEEIEAHGDAAFQSMATVLLACLAGGVAVSGRDSASTAGFITGMTIVLAAWLVWVTVVAAVGTIALAEPQTQSDLGELLRTMGFAAAPGVFLAFASIRPAAPFVIALVSVWMTAAAVIGVRQALDFRSTSRATAVCALGLVIALGVVAAIASLLTVEVNS